uniref:Uncharacterized protein n=1 Tax=Conchiformibius kuhniae TaxID=211502 RepID=A0A8T9MWF3_9NEIS|nr:hypothetical protein LVJ77_02600 [Conchiformibius kuhniae]
MHTLLALSPILVVFLLLVVLRWSAKAAMVPLRSPLPPRSRSPSGKPRPTWWQPPPPTACLPRLPCCTSYSARFCCSTP